LRRCLESLELIRYQGEWEVTVVDNGSTDETQSVISDFKNRVATKVNALSCAKPGLGMARNVGWKASQGEIIAFTDDDCYPEPDLLTSIIDIFEKEPSLGFLGGRVLLYDPTDYHCATNEKTERVDVKPKSLLLGGFISGANFSFRRSALEAVGGFDDDLGAGTNFYCEDLEILARLSAKGWPGAFDPAPVVYHHHERKTQAEADRLELEYVYARGAYYAKCLLSPPMRLQYARMWFWYMRHQPLETTAREVAAAMAYYRHRLASSLAGRGFLESPRD
jgi:GT2 family glycosyltransferase